MAGTLVVSTLSDGTKSGSVGNLVGLAGIRAMCTFNGQNTATILNSHNVTSLTDRGTGKYTLNFTTAMPNAYYAFAGAGRDTDGAGDVFLGQASTEISTTTTLPFRTINGGNNAGDYPYFCVIVV